MLRSIAALSGLFAGCGVLCASTAVGVSPGAGSGASQSFTFTLESSTVSADISAFDVLINNEFNGRGACYLTFVPVSGSSGYVSLVDDSSSGYAGGSPMPLPSAGGLQNSQCTIHGTASSFSTSGNTSTLTLDVTFSPGFAGNKIVYTAARRVTQGSSWQASGTWRVPGPAAMGPAVEEARAGQGSTGQTYAFTFTDTNGYGDLGRLDILTNNLLSAARACHSVFVPTSASSGYLYLADDAGDGFVNGSPILLPSANRLKNGQCEMSAAESWVSANGNALTLNLAIQFSSAFAGNRLFYLAARDHGTGNSGWQAAGSVVIGHAVSGSYTTNFPLSENPIAEGGNWIGGSTAGASLWGNVQTTAGLAFGVSEPTQFGDPTAILNGNWGPNQTVQGTVKVVATPAGSCCREIELRLRTTISSNSITGYEAYCSTLPDNQYCHIARWNGPNGSYCNLENSPAIAYIANGDVMKATVTGTNPVTITLYKNGVQLLQTADNGGNCSPGGPAGPFTSGNPGIGFYDDQDDNWSNFGFSSFSASDGTNPTPPSAPANLLATVVSSSEIDLSWTAATDPNYAASQLTYGVYRNGIHIGTTAAGAVSWADTNLAASTTYTYAVAANDPAGSASAQSAAVQATTSAARDSTPPSIPTNLSITGATASTVSLSWTASTDNVGVTGYNIYRGGVPIGTSAVASYTNTALAASTTYTYAVAAFDSAGNVSAQSAAIQAVTLALPDTTSPSVPANLSVTGTTASSISLSWTTSTDNVGVAGYNIYRGGVLTGTSTVASYANTALSPATNYTYTVAAYDAAGNVSAQSAAVPATTLASTDSTPPTVPANLTVTGTTASSVSLAWTPSTDNVGVAGYNIYRGGVLAGTLATTSYTNTGLTASTTFSYTVAAYDAAGNVSAQSAAVQATTLVSTDSTPPTVPTNLTVTGTTASSVSLSWTPSADNVGVAGYNIYRGGVLAGTSAVASYSNTALAGSTTYTYTIAAYDAVGNVSAQSSAVQATTLASTNATPPTVPANLSVTGTTASSISMAWTASTDNAGVAGYNVYRGGILIATSAITSYTNTALVPNTTYSYSVAAYDAAGNISGRSAAVQATTLASTDTSPPTIPTNLSVTAKSAFSVSLSWTASSDNVGVAGYNIYRGGVLTGLSSGTSYTNTGLAASTAYTFTVAGYDAAGNVSVQSAAVQVTTAATADTTPPSVPANLSITGTTASTISLSWAPSTDNVGVAGYHLYRGGALAATLATTFYTDNSLSASTTYSYTVSAYDAAGNTSAQTALASATTSTRDILAPAVSLSSPANDQTVSATITLTASAVDKLGIAGVQFQLDGVSLGPEIDAEPYSTSWDTSQTRNGSHVLTVLARDVGGNSAVSSGIAITVANASAGLDRQNLPHNPRVGKPSRGEPR